MRGGSQLLVAASLALSLPASATSLPPRVDGEELVPGHVIVRYRTAPQLRRDDARIERQVDDRTLLLHAHDDSEAGTDALVARLAADPSVASLEREHYRRRTGQVLANDPLFKMQWNLGLARLPAAWSRTEGSQRIVVAVLDSGIRAHPDLQPRYLGGYDFISSDANADDNQPGRDPDPTDTGGPQDTSSALHGMHVAGIIGAHTDNAVGIAGVDWNCRILPVRVLGVQGGKGTDLDIADAIRWAAGVHVNGVPDNATPADVINMSFGGPGGSAVLQAAIDQASRVGAIVVAAAGNDGADTATYAPAGLPHVIAVGAVDSRGQLAYYSNRGPRVDLVAPGGDLTSGPGVLSTLWNSTDGYTYVAFNGTSQAAPHVAGVAALMKSIDRGLTSDHARDILASSADPSRQCAEGCGGGLLDADAAVAAVVVACSDGHCDRPDGRDVVGGLTAGCALPGRGPGARPLVLSAIALFLVGLGLLLRRRAV